MILLVAVVIVIVMLALDCYNPLSLITEISQILRNSVTYFDYNSYESDLMRIVKARSDTILMILNVEVTSRKLMIISSNCETHDWTNSIR